MMKKLLAGAALLGLLGAPAMAQGHATSVDSPSSTQSVYRTVSTTEILNSDGSVSEITVVTVYYVFGYE